MFLCENCLFYFFIFIFILFFLGGGLEVLYKASLRLSFTPFTYIACLHSRLSSSTLCTATLVPSIMASSSTPLGATVLERFQTFLQTTEWSDRGDLHKLFTHYPDVNTTVQLNLESFQCILDFMGTFIDKYAVPIYGREYL